MSKRKYTVRNVRAFAQSQKINSQIAVLRRAHLSPELSARVEKLKKDDEDLAGKTTSEVVNYIVADWFNLTLKCKGGNDD